MEDYKIYPGQIWISEDKSVYCEIVSIYKRTPPIRVKWIENNASGGQMHKTTIDRLFLWILQQNARPIVEVFTKTR